MSLIERKYYGNFFYKTEKRYDNNLEAIYVLFNWAFPKNLISSMALADKISSGKIVSHEIEFAKDCQRKARQIG